MESTTLLNCILFYPQTKGPSGEGSPHRSETRSWTSSAGGPVSNHPLSHQDPCRARVHPGGAEGEEGHVIESFTKMWPWYTKPVIKVIFFKIEIYASSESWINNFLLMYGFRIDTIIWKSGIWGCKKKSKYWENRLYSCPKEVLISAYY